MASTIYFVEEYFFLAKTLSKLAAPAQVDDLEELSSKYVHSLMAMVTKF